MVPSLPVELPDRVLETQLKTALLHCSMLYLEQPCGNMAQNLILYPTSNGCYTGIAICDMCMGNLPDGWFQSLEQKNAQESHL